MQNAECRMQNAELREVYQELKQQNEEEQQKAQSIREECDSDFENKVINLLQEQAEYQRSIKNVGIWLLFVLILILIVGGILTYNIIDYISFIQS